MVKVPDPGLLQHDAAAFGHLVEAEQAVLLGGL